MERDENGEPLCRGFDWTERAWVPSDLAEERLVGKCSYLSSYVDYDDEGEPCEEHESVDVRYYVQPCGRAVEVRCTERPWGSGEIEVHERVHAAGTWLVDYWASWPRDFGARSGVRILQIA